jgi:eukaryotic-like serine/threonine-protein kinase
MPPQTAGKVISGGFQLEEPIAEGAMGSIWRANYLDLDAPVAVKFMKKLDALDEENARQRFVREAMAVSSIRSRHVVQVLGYGIDEHNPFIVMEWLEGEDLGARLKRVSILSFAETSFIMAQAAEGLRVAHEAGVVHRDLKPGNIFLARTEDGEVVKLLDFGIAKLMPSSFETGPITGTGELIGTPQYMSPEQARGSKQLDHRSDVWSLGVIAYRALTGRPPFRGDTPGAILVNVCTEPLKPPSSVLPGVSTAVDRFFELACAKEPSRRFQSVLEMASAFAALAEQPLKSAAEIEGDARETPVLGSLTPAAGDTAGGGATAMREAGARKAQSRMFHVAVLLLGLLAVVLLSVLVSMVAS